MEFDFLTIEKVAILLLGLSELLGTLPGFKSNSVFLLVVNFLKRLAGKDDE